MNNSGMNSTQLENSTEKLAIPDSNNITNLTLIDATTLLPSTTVTCLNNENVTVSLKITFIKNGRKLI
jgi:hypothetical protein